MMYASLEEMNSGEKLTSEEAFEWMDKVVSAWKTLGEYATPDIYIGHPFTSKEIQMVGVANLAISAELPYTIEPWDGNDNVVSDYLEVWFDYKGYRFFELEDNRKEK